MTPSKPYDLSRAAARNLEDMFLHGLTHFGLEQAKRYRAEILAVLDIIADNPELGRLRSEIAPPVRVHPHRSHVLIYVLGQKRRPLILQIRDAREAWTVQPHGQS